MADAYHNEDATSNVVDAASTRFLEFCANGFPLCPACGLNELISEVVMRWDGQDPIPPLEIVLAGSHKCFRCHWNVPSEEDVRDGAGLATKADRDGHVRRRAGRPPRSAQKSDPATGCSASRRVEAGSAGETDLRSPGRVPASEAELRRAATRVRKGVG